MAFLKHTWQRMGVGLVVMTAMIGVGFVLIFPHQAPIATSIPIALTSVPAEFFYLDGRSITRRGPGRIMVVRIDGAAELVPFHFRHMGFDRPKTITAWAKELGLPIVLNAGQFNEAMAHLGWLKADGRWLVPHKHSSFEGLLLSGPTDGAPWGRIADLKETQSPIEHRYRHVIQSMMLFDAAGSLRVRDSDKSACRTVIAEDTRGRLLVVITQGAVTLGDLGRWLQKRLDTVRAMNLDGGLKSQLAIATPEMSLNFYGQYGTEPTVFEATPGDIRVALPTVIGVRPLGPQARAKP